MTQYRLQPARGRQTKAILVGILLSGIVVTAIYAGAIWIRDHTFPPPDPIELRHRIETAGVWPVMLQLALKVLDGKKVTWTGGPDTPIYFAARMNGMSVFEDGQSVSGVYFSFGGAENEYGVLVRRPGATIPAGWKFRYIQRWGDGIWYVADNAPRVPRIVRTELPR